MAMTVREVAELTGLSVRALHHYHKIGLLTPRVAANGYRLYGEAELARLHQIMLFRELEFPLATIREMLANPQYDRGEALRTQRQMLVCKQQRLDRLIAALDRTLQAMERGTEMNKESMFDGLDDARLKEYAAEAKQRWGQTDAYKESTRRVAGYSKQDWAEIQGEMESIWRDLAAQMELAPEDPAVQANVERWWRLLNERFYNASPALFKGLGEMYVADERFKVNYEKLRPGLAEFLRAAMAVFADRRQTGQ